MNRTTVTDAVYDTCVELLRADRSTLSESTHFANDLEADSLDLSEVIMALEDQLGVEISDDHLDGVETIGQAVDMVLRIASADA